MTEGKKLLVLGGTYASYDVVKNAREMGVHTIVADYYEHGMAKGIADETVLISTTDIEGLSKFIRAKGIDGVFCGPSEFNIRNMIRLHSTDMMRGRFMRIRLRVRCFRRRPPHPGR